MRCSFRRVQEVDEADADTSFDGQHFKVGDPCGGKLKRKNHHGQFVGAECVTCGRFYPVPKVEVEAPQAREAA